MRKTQNQQLLLGELPISEINLGYKSRDDIPQILKGLQYIYTNKEIRENLFSVLEELIPGNINKSNGRPGMDLWRIFVLGTLRLNLNWDYDRLHEMSNNHKVIRQMLGHGSFDEYCYNLQTLKDNIRLLTPEILDKINQIVVSAGHNLIKKKRKRT